MLDFSKAFDMHCISRTCLRKAWTDSNYPLSWGLRGLTFTWWGCYGLCQRYKSTEHAHSFLLCSCVFFSLMALSTVFHSINSSDNSPFSYSLLPVLSLPYWSFQLYDHLFMKVSFSPAITRSGWLGSKHQLTNLHCPERDYSVQAIREMPDIDRDFQALHR